jgi:hypothetical protein
MCRSPATLSVTACSTTTPGKEKDKTESPATVIVKAPEVIAPANQVDHRRWTAQRTTTSIVIWERGGKAISGRVIRTRLEIKVVRTPVATVAAECLAEVSAAAVDGDARLRLDFGQSGEAFDSHFTNLRIEGLPMLNDAFFPREAADARSGWQPDSADARDLYLRYQ